MNIDMRRIPKILSDLGFYKRSKTNDIYIDIENKFGVKYHLTKDLKTEWHYFRAINNEVLFKTENIAEMIIYLKGV